MTSIFDDIYRSPSSLSMVDGGRRIYAPIAYPLVRTLQVVPIVHTEALSLAARFPICWHRTSGGATLVALRSLRPDGTGHPPGSSSKLGDLPLILRAYPFVVSSESDIAQQPTETPIIEDATADRATDIGAPILLPDGRPGRGAEYRLQAARLFRASTQVTSEITSYVEKHDLFEPWSLSFGTESDPISVHDLSIIRQDSFGTRAIVQMLAQLGAPAASLLAAHRLSLFRAGELVVAAQKARPITKSSH